MGETKTTEWGGFILFFLIFALVFGGGRSLFGGGAANGCNVVSNCEIEKSVIEEAARNYVITTQSASNTQALVQAEGNNTRQYLGNKIDFYEYQNLRDKIAERDALIAQLKSEAFASAKFNALEAQIAAMSCELSKKPNTVPVYASGVTACGQPVPNSICGLV